MSEIWMDVDIAITIPVNKVPLVALSDGYTIDETIAYNESGMDLNWNFVTTAGVMTQTNVVPTTAGDYDWTHIGNGMYKIEMTASGGASADNDTEGFGWFSGKADAILPFSGPIIGFRADALNNALIDGGDNLDINVVQWLGQACHAVSENGVPKVDLDQLGGVVQSLTDLKDLVDTGYDPTNHKIQSDLIYIHGSALTETAGQLAAAFVKLLDVATPVLTAESVNQSANNNTILAHADHGNAQLVRSTTPANKLDVSATGEAGLDFANIKNATGAHTLTNITIPTCTTNTDMRGTDGANTIVPDTAGIAAGLHATTDGKIDDNKSELDGLQGADGKCVISTDAQDLSASLDVNTKTATATALDLILKDSTFALAIADAIWDEILTGATHNISTSAGRKVRQIGAYAIHDGTAQAGANVSITLAATASAIDGTYNRNLVVITGGTGIGQTRTIIDFNGTTKIAIVDRGWRTDPDATSEYQVVPDDTPLVVDQGVAQAGSTSSTIKLRAYASATNDIYLCNIVIIIAGTGRGQARLVDAYNGATKVITLCGDDWTTTPDDTSVYVIIPYGVTCTACLGANALASINTEVDNVLNTAIPGSPTADSINEKIKALPSGIAKNVALSAFTFYMVLTSDHVSAATGKTLTGQISKDGGAFAGLTNSITEIGNGLYKVDIIQAEMNADVVTLKFTETDCDQRIVVIYPT
ncbi:MAG: hypothetical protein IMY74_11420 [Bacteroidetes bacterium]|nr:hypothetical protein [Bacteroidota bacterium]